MVLKRLFQRRAADADPPAAPPDTRIYAIGDIHGCHAQLERLHTAILADAAGAPARRLLVYLGDYVDRGPESKAVLETLTQAPPDGFERIFIKGNHEDFMLQVLDDKSVFLPWLMNGGDATCRSYGIEPTAPPDGSDDLLGWLQQALREALPGPHRDFLAALQLHHVEGDYYFCHAGIRPGVALEAQVDEDLMWIRDPFLASRASHGKVVVHGHTPVGAPERRANRIGIDTGACYGGQLTAVVLDGHEQRFLQA